MEVISGNQVIMSEDEVRASRLRSPFPLSSAPLYLALVREAVQHAATFAAQVSPDAPNSLSDALPTLRSMEADLSDIVARSGIYADF